MKTIKVELDARSIENAIKELRDYRDGITVKLNTMIDQLTQEGIQVANYYVSAARGDSKDATVGYNITSDGDIVKAVIFLEGTEALFIEFGAGISYNTGPEHPKAEEFGYGVGTYPSKHPPNRAINPGRWVYDHYDDGTPIWSIGTEGTMPMYRAAENARNKAIAKAIEVFRS